MNIDTTISIQILRWGLRITPLHMSFDDWGTSLKLLEFSFSEEGTTDYDKEYSAGLFTYLKVKYLHRLEICGIDIFCKFK